MPSFPEIQPVNNSRGVTFVTSGENVQKIVKQKLSRDTPQRKKEPEKGITKKINQ